MLPHYFFLYSKDIVKIKTSNFFPVIAVVNYFDCCFILHSDSPFLVLFCTTNILLFLGLTLSVGPVAPDETIASHRLSHPVFPSTSDSDKKTFKKKKVNQLFKTMVSSVCLWGKKRKCYLFGKKNKIKSMLWKLSDFKIQ